MSRVDLRQAIRECPAGVTSMGIAAPLYAPNDLLEQAVGEIEKRVLLQAMGDPMTACERLSLWLIAALYEAQHGKIKP